MRATIHSLMVLAVAAAPSAAQGRVEVTPFAGVYVPAAHVIDISAFCPGGPRGAGLQQKIAPPLRARVTHWGRERPGTQLPSTYSRDDAVRHRALAGNTTSVYP